MCPIMRNVLIDTGCSAGLLKVEIGYNMALDGNSDIGAQIWSNLLYLICLRNLIDSSPKSDFFFLSEKTYFPLYVRNMI